MQNSKQPVAIIYSDGSIEVVAPTSVGALLIGAQRIEASVQQLQVMPPQAQPPLAEAGAESD